MAARCWLLGEAWELQTRRQHQLQLNVKAQVRHLRASVMTEWITPFSSMPYSPMNRPWMSSIP